MVASQSGSPHKSASTASSRSPSRQASGLFDHTGHRIPATTGAQVLQARIEASQRVGVHATIYLGNGDTYKGEWESDKMHGRGVYHCKSDGSVYSGTFVFGKREGQGTLMVPVTPKEPASTSTTQREEAERQTDKIVSSSLADPDAAHLRLLYKGQWQNNHYEGKGAIYYDDGTVYQGEWVNGAQKGWGSMDYADGSRYEGEWQAGKRHGHGKLTLRNAYYFFDSATAWRDSNCTSQS